VTRWFGTPLALSIVAHAGAVATVLVFGAAWLLGSPGAPAPPALYVDLVHPVVATSDRPGTGDGAGPRHPAERSRNGGVAPRSQRGGMPSTEKTTGSPVPTITPAPTIDPPGAVSAAPEVPRPPTAPVAPRAPAVAQTSVPSAASVAERPAPLPRVAAAPSPASVDPGPRGPAADIGATPSLALPPTSAPVAPSGDSGVGRHATPGSSTTGARESSERGAGVPANTGPGGLPDGSGPASSARGGAPAAGDGAGVARLSPGDGQAGDVPPGAIPPEYEAFVRTLRQRVQERLVYPWAAVRRGQQGVVELEVRLGADGRLVGVEVVAGVGADALRGAAVSAVRSSAPFPFPPGLMARALVVRLPVEFRLR
jgi:TonB family protein